MPAEGDAGGVKDKVGAMLSTAEGLLLLSLVDVDERAVVKDSTEGDVARVIGGSWGIDGRDVIGGGFGFG